MSNKTDLEIFVVHNLIIIWVIIVIWYLDVGTGMSGINGKIVSIRIANEGRIFPH